MRSIFISGANQGLGLAAATHLAATPNILLFLGSRKIEAIQEAVAKPEFKVDATSKVVPVQLDITDKASIEKAVESVKETLQAEKKEGLDVLVNNAGISTGTWEEIYSVNVFGTSSLTSSLRPLLTPSKASIINVSSSVGSSAHWTPDAPMLQVDYPKPTLYGYPSSKSAVNALTNIWAAEEKKNGSGVSVVSVCPGFNATKMTGYHPYGTAPEEGSKVIVKAALDESPVSPSFYDKDGPLAWILDYHSDDPTFALAFSPLSTSSSSLKLAVGSFVESRSDSSTSNHLTIIGLPSLDSDADFDSPMNGLSISSGAEFIPLAKAPHPYPPSAVAFSPQRLSSTLQNSSSTTKGDVTRELVATSSDCLRIYDVVGGAEEEGSRSLVGQSARSQGGGTNLVQRAVLANTKADYSAPLTSFSWSTLEPTHIVTSSIDTTCTVWDISNGVPITQLIAHDREVYDVAWSPSARDAFASVGADGSVRMFDLRSLEHSTILYEANMGTSSKSSASSSKNGTGTTTGATGESSPTPSPLLRLAFSTTNAHYLSVCHANTGDIVVLDTRNPGQPTMEIKAHSGNVNGMAWGGSTMSNNGETAGPGWLATCADDCTLLIWDMSTAPPVPSGPVRTGQPLCKPLKDPVLYYNAPAEINAVAWGGGGDWVAAGMGRLVRCLKV